MKTLKIILISFISGLTAVIPGVSGGTIFAVFNISEELTLQIKELTKFKKATFLKNLKLPLIIGLGSYLSSLMYAKFFLTYFEMLKYFISYLFIGLIIFSLPILWSETKSVGSNKIKKLQKKSYINYIYFLIGLSIALIMYSFSTDETSKTLDMNLIEYIQYALVSMIAGVMTILPGISGTNIMILFGEYGRYVEYSANFGHYLLPNIVFLISTLIGTIASSYIIVLLFSKYKAPFFAIITGLTFSTIYVLFTNPFVSTYVFAQSFAGIIVGYLLINKLTQNHN